MQKTINDKMSPEKWASRWFSRQTRHKKDEIKNLLKQWALKDFNRMLGMLIDLGSHKKMNIVELGCAPGLILKELHQVRPAHNYYGIDYSKRGLGLARTYLEKFGIKAELIHADVRTYVPDHKFDMVMSFGLIEHFDDPVQILAVQKRMVTPNGWVIASVPNLSNYYVKKALKKFRPIDFKTHHMEIMSIEALKQAFKSAGFRNINAGGAVGPLLPTPYDKNTLTARIYTLFSYLWNGCIRFIPPGHTWYGYYWACGQVLKR